MLLITIGYVKKLSDPKIRVFRGSAISDPGSKFCFEIFQMEKGLSKSLITICLVKNCPIPKKVIVTEAYFFELDTKFLAPNCTQMLTLQPLTLRLFATKEHFRASDWFCPFGDNFCHFYLISAISPVKWRLWTAWYISLFRGIDLPFQNLPRTHAEKGIYCQKGFLASYQPFCKCGMNWYYWPRNIKTPRFALKFAITAGNCAKYGKTRRFSCGLATRTYCIPMLCL